MNEQQIGRVEQLSTSRPIDLAIAVLRDNAEDIARDQAGDVLTQRLARIDQLEALVKAQQERIKAQDEDITHLGNENDRLSKLVQTDQYLMNRAVLLDKRESELNEKAARIEADAKVREAEKARDIALAEMRGSLNVVGMFTRNPSWMQTASGHVPVVTPGWTPPAGSGGYPQMPMVTSGPVNLSQTVKAE